jgi:hypothetical protein
VPRAYRDGVYLIDGEPADAAEVTAHRDAQVERWGDELRRLAIDELGDGEAVVAIEFPISRIEAFATRFLTRVGEIVTSAYTWAAGGVEIVTDEGWRTIARLVERQEAFGRGFVEALRGGRLSPQQAAARARLYAGATVEAFERGKAAQVGFEPPAWPAEGCEGTVNCRCYWEIVEFPDRFEGTWVAVGDKNTCGWCSDNAKDYAPWKQPK